MTVSVIPTAFHYTQAMSWQEEAPTANKFCFILFFPGATGEYFEIVIYYFHNLMYYILMDNFIVDSK